MAKPDLQAMRITPAGGLFRDDGKLGLAPAFDGLLTAYGPGDAAASGIGVGQVYIDATTSGLAVRQE
jgi:hypothetical protein